ncbi:hypothetical protein PRUPE_4G281000 [Prunus persica]|uniref:Uncharacterized protein n=1 Tax=Prunus persica TaxID=3760 RepID=A0A251PS99_PRUPE|nr:hypothetical protein PRUPE_4G281000 [Prunus persica]
MVREREGERARETERGGWKHNEGEVSKRLMPRFFNIEAKEFRIKVDDLSYGGSILISEKVKERLFHVSLELSCVEWLINELQLILENKVQSVFRSYRGDSYQVWVEKGHNWKGYYLRLTKCVHGFTKSVVIPQGKNDSGWIQIKENLAGILKGKNRTSRHWFTEEDGNTAVSARDRVLGKTYKDAVLNEGVVQEQEKGYGSSDDTTNWSWVVVCERLVLHQPWDGIRKAMEGRLEKNVILFPYQINRAFFSCDSKTEALKVCSSGKLAVEGQTDVLLYSWEHGLKNNIPKIVSYGGWIGINGLPMHWWNKEFFQRIGLECGGLLQVDQRTENYLYLFEARIKTRKNFIGFLPEILTLTEGTESYHVKIRPISPAIRPTRSRHGQPRISANGTVQAVAGGEVLTSQRQWRVVENSQVDWARSNINEFDWLEKGNRSCFSGTSQNLKFQGDGTSIIAAENLILPPFMSALSDKATKDIALTMGPIIGWRRLE